MISEIKEINKKEPLETYDISFLRSAEYGGWCMEKDTCQFIGRLCEKIKPQRVLEFGTGLSTLVLAHEAAKGNVGKIWSIDHLADFPGHPREILAQSNEKRLVDFCHFSLKLTYLGGKIFLFYAFPKDFFNEIGLLDLVIIDGPPYYYNGREAALYAVYPHLSPKGLILLDDAGRKKKEQVYLKNWKRYYGRNIDNVIFLDEFKKGLACIWLTDYKDPISTFTFGERLKDS